jgi:predicted dehydrogenase
MTRLALFGSGGQMATEYAHAAARIRNARLTVLVNHSTSDSGSSWDELLKRHASNFDAAVIHTPLDQRAETARSAAAAGKHVFLASPMARSAAEAEEVITACRAAGVRLMIGESLRFRPSIAAVKAALDSRKLGDPALLRVHSWQPPRPGANELYGDVIWSQAAQHLDLAKWMFSGLPTEIFVLGKAGQTDARRGPEYVQIHLGFPRGGMALISLAHALPAGDGYDSLSLVGSTGAAYADDHYQTHLLYRGGTPAALKAREGIAAATAQLREFIDAVESNRDPSVTGADGKIALQLTDAARRAWIDRGPLRVEGALDAIRA